MKKKEAYGFLWSLLHPFRWIIVGAVLLAAATVLANVGLLSVSAVLISFAALQPPLLDLMVYIVGVRFFGISRALLRYSERYVSHKITFRILTALRVQVYAQIEPTAPAGLQQEPPECLRQCRLQWRLLRPCTRACIRARPCEPPPRRTA